MRRTRAFALASLVACALAGASAWPAKTPKPSPARPAPTEQDLQELRDRIDKLQKDLAAREGTRSEANEQLRASAKAVSDAQRALFDLQQRRRTLEAELAAIGERERAARAGVARQQQLASNLLRMQYRQGAPDRLRLLLEGRDAAEVARHLVYYDYIQRARATLIASLRSQEQSIAALAADAAQRRDDLRDNERQQAEEARRLERERSARAAVVARLGTEIARDRQQIGRLKRDEARLSRLVEEIARAIAKSPAPPAKGRTIDQVADASLAARPFASLKGVLKLPVRGELANRYGGAREESGATWKGLFIRTVSGETVHAVADGRVVYADWLRGFGNLLILDHGAGYMSLYANNEGLLRQVGETVRSGDPIAHVGATDVAAESGLYFELRRDGKPFDPLGWVAP
ncbi:MAG TPA: peptidoglycan DD-metalloendopeptidase family protein [Usitatibacter sp.]|nr:peptidoglycan DD-metalloendopeptidase family protein [Usitatibacter sp.]